MNMRCERHGDNCQDRFRNYEKLLPGEDERIVLKRMGVDQYQVSGVGGNFFERCLVYSIEVAHSLRIKNKAWLEIFDKQYGWGSGAMSREFLKECFYLDRNF